MRIVIDMQGAQTESRFRGIGRYVLGFAKGVARVRGEHEVVLVLNGMLRESIEAIRAEFEGLLPQENIRVWQAIGPVEEVIDDNVTRREIAELSWESFLASLRPDVVHVGSLFEGVTGYGVSSVGQLDHATPVSVTLHDLIPLVHAKRYLDPHPVTSRHYYRKIGYLQKAALLLANSEFSRQEGIEYLDYPAERIIAVSSAIEDSFKPISVDAAEADRLRRQFGINASFLLYTGGADERKNLPRLIEAYSQLSGTLRAKVQLVFVGKIPESVKAELYKHAAQFGVGESELKFTGFVSDADLHALYAICDAFVFPSWHEGFGLPVLEAMACGAPVICAHAGSLPEVMGWQDAMFDPMDVPAMSRKLAEVLEDPAFRQKLREHGLVQSGKFSWDAVGRRAFAEWEKLAAPPRPSWLEQSRSQEHLIELVAAKAARSADRNMLVPLAACLAQNEKTGYVRQILVDVSEFCQNDAGTGVQRVVRNYLDCLLKHPPAGYRVEPVYATLTHGYRYARRFTQKFLGAPVDESIRDSDVQWQRGDVFLGLDMQHSVQIAQAAFYQKLRQQGVCVKFLVYDLLPIEFPEYFFDANLKTMHERLLAVMATTDGTICISKATSDALLAWIRDKNIPTSPNFSSTWAHIGVDFPDVVEGGLPPDAATVIAAMQRCPSFLCVSTIEPRKNQAQVLEAVEALWAAGQDVCLTFVGRLGWKMDALADKMRKHPEFGKRLFWLAGVDDNYLISLYKAASGLVAASVNEGFGLSLIEAAYYGLPVIARDIPVFREVAGDGAYYFGGNSAGELGTALAAWLELYRLGQHPKPTGISWLNWEDSTALLASRLLDGVSNTRQLLVDISELVQRDARSGIQRVVRSILREWVLQPPVGYRIEPVYATADQPYRYARTYMARFLGKEDDSLTDDPIEYGPGDVFLGLDLAPAVVPHYAGFYQNLREQGVRVKFVVYDLLPLRDNHFEQHVVDHFVRWLDVVAESDGALCISKAVADEFEDWMAGRKIARQRPFALDWFHLGSDIANSVPTTGMPKNAASVLDALAARASFLMVGTLEPRKGHAQVLEAFEQLWAAGVDANLVIVGKQGWMMDNLANRLRSHTERDRRLFWLESISDEFLEKVYAASGCLIAASTGEGFGLPLIEAAQHGVPILARDLPVFREVAGEHAAYFTANDASALAGAIREWLAGKAAGTIPVSTGMPFLSWRQSAAMLTEKI
ncbi:glycosyltransferase family 1 protein [Burkholderia sp. IDO3]|uniref:glycosyltransferase family 4 protein n=1 Tax=Burkholderia sp. IDO3 TaxID=1705310 RepID=UPI000BBAE3E1|nr:glycosyltransferase family 1 protein [Burkholderia sp. IDO3]AXK64698.1 glycosyltransferase family 1 protein [Burkholderia sp. IDO3]PCD61255.1 mannosyltransferase [Burkholderia sp. IDO3]